MRSIKLYHRMDISILDPGSFFGYEDALKQQPRAHNCVANTECIVLTLAISEFYRRITNKETWDEVHSSMTVKDNFTRFRKR
jgi:CRP-like cAMP-binding protein